MRLRGRVRWKGKGGDRGTAAASSEGERCTRCGIGRSDHCGYMPRKHVVIDLL